VGRLRVLLAEDHELMADLLRRLLEADCEVVGIVGDGRSLVRAAEALAPEVIVSDITMPGIDGLEAARVILKRQPDARIVFVTVRDDPSVVREALSVGALGYVLKADASEELITAVQAAGSGRPHLSTNIRTNLHGKAAKQ
jgi:DNA-binding NarL/FixJ family response regulator